MLEQLVSFLLMKSHFVWEFALHFITEVTIGFGEVQELVKSSKPEDEFEEMNNKMKTFVHLVVGKSKETREKRTPKHHNNRSFSDRWFIGESYIDRT